MFRGIEWPTVAVTVLCYICWGVGTTVLAEWHLGVAVVVVALSVALFSSLQHEIIHGHPFAQQWLNEALVFPAFNLAIPYTRFRDTHLAHHYDAELTDPYDDPESNFVSLDRWQKLPPVAQLALRFNNTLLGRLMIGPVISQVMFLSAERAFGWGAIWRGWAAHLVGVMAVILWLLVVGSMPIWAYLAAAYLSLSVIKIRTFLEHQAHEKSRGRTVIIEDRGPLSFLFLNNNLHAVHHMHPKVPWYQLPAVYARGKARYLSCNGGYVFRSYAQIFRSYFLARKDEVAHPLWYRD